MQQWMMIAAAIAGFALQPTASAAARDYPERPITLIVPQAPGGGNDVIARILAETMSRTLGHRSSSRIDLGPEARSARASSQKVRLMDTRWSWAAPERWRWPRRCFPMWDMIRARTSRRSD